MQEKCNRSENRVIAKVIDVLLFLTLGCQNMDDNLRKWFQDMIHFSGVVYCPSDLWSFCRHQRFCKWNAAIHTSYRCRYIRCLWIAASVIEPCIQQKIAATLPNIIETLPSWNDDHRSDIECSVRLNHSSDSLATILYVIVVLWPKQTPAILKKIYMYLRVQCTDSFI
jgi:hypothetical protein